MFPFKSISEEVIEKYEPLLAKPIDSIKKEIKDLTDGYFKAIIEKDNDSVKAIVNEINSYIELDVPEFNEYLYYCLLNSIQELLSNLYDDDLELYVPSKVDLIFQRQKDKQAKYHIEKSNLTPEEVDLIIKYNIEKNDINCLRDLGYEFNNLKPKTVLPPHLKEEIYLINTNYTAEKHIETVAKFFYTMDSIFDKEEVDSNEN